VKLYVKKLKFYTAMNLSFLAVGILSLTACIVLKKYIGEKLIPLNIICLIGFIMTLWRVRIYITKTALAIDLPGKDYFLSTLSGPIGITLAWIHAFALIKKCNPITSGHKSTNVQVPSES
jgi:hypothetical protein